jgi:hypothetical protein
MRPVNVRIMHPEPAIDAGPLSRWLAGARADIAQGLAARFAAAGADDVAVVSGPPDGVPFGARLRALAERDRPDGLVVLGSGAIPLARDVDLRDLVVAAGADQRAALANDFYSADVVAIGRSWPTLADVPDRVNDNGLPRWLASVAGYRVADLRRRGRLAVDVDGPLDLVLLGRAGGAKDTDIDTARIRAAIEAVRQVSMDPNAELLVAGRSSASTLAWLERSTASRTRALVEERGLRSRSSGQRPPASIIGIALDRNGPGSLGAVVARLADAAIIDSRVLLAHRLGADEHAWPAPEDRFASDLLLVDRIGDPWLRDLTAAAIDAPVPILLGGHSLVGPGIRLALRRRAWS